MREKSAENIWDGAEKWIKRNPDAWSYIDSTATKMGSEGRRISISKLVEDARSMGHINGSDDGFSTNNNFRSAFARKLVSEHPELDPYIERRKSKLDELCRS